MKTHTTQALRWTLALCGLVSASLAASAASGDWPMWGNDHTRNMVAVGESGLPSSFVAGEFIGLTDDIDMATTENIKWIAKLGSQCYGNPTVANGVVFVGTNNDSPRDARYAGDRSVVNALDEATGELIWQLNVPKLGTGKVSDWEFLGICSSPAVEGDRVYVLTNRCEVMCLDFNGLADGNDGPFTDEAQYYTARGEEPQELAATDADIIWKLDMIDECGVFPHNITSSSVLIAGDLLWVSTSNGVDYGHVETPAPTAPCLITVNKHTGELVGEEASGLSERIFHGNWTSPAYLATESQELCIFGGPDGRVYAFTPETRIGEQGWPILEEAWRFDANPPAYRFKDGEELKYATREGPSEVMGTPVTVGDRVYASIGQDPEHGSGIGNLVCIDATKRGDITDVEGALIWSYTKINRSLSTVAVVGDLLFAADFSGFVYCLDANTGEEHWVHDTMAHIWGSPLVADGKVYIGNEDGYLTILPASAERTEGDVIEIDMQSPIFSSPIAANGTLYVASHTHLFAIADVAQER